jgi:ribosome biogenesis GTPase
VSLDELGLTAGTLSLFEPYAADGCILGRVAVSIRDEYRVLTATGEVRAEPTGALLYSAGSRADLPSVGDWVAMRPAGGDYAVVCDVLPRATLIARRAAGRTEDQQPMAANVDTVLIVCGLDRDFNPRRLERYATLVYESCATGIVVLTKSDLRSDASSCVEQAASAAAGMDVVAISSIEDDGLAALQPRLESRKTFVMVGSSGAGKSTLLNRLLSDERQRTAPVRESDNRGRHTTTHRELIVLPNGAIFIDTPGMREVGLWAGEESLSHTFDEIADLAERCRFRDCSHNGEPGCAVAAAVDPARLESYHKLQREVRRHEQLADHTPAAVERLRWKQIMKAHRAKTKIDQR